MSLLILSKTKKTDGVLTPGIRRLLIHYSLVDTLNHTTRDPHGIPLGSVLQKYFPRPGSQELDQIRLRHWNLSDHELRMCEYHQKRCKKGKRVKTIKSLLISIPNNPHQKISKQNDKR